MPPADLPPIVARISPCLPTSQFADLLWSVPNGGVPIAAIGGLALYALAFAVAASIGYRRDEKTRYA
jgi:hypothetical protein